MRNLNNNKCMETTTEKTISLEALQQELEKTQTALNQVKQKCSTWKHEAEEQTDIADRCLKTMRGLLMKWTGDKSLAEKTSKMLGFNSADRQTEMIAALMDYLHTGDKYLFDHEVQRTMFRVMCERIDTSKG